MDVVINACFGGFSLSREALHKLRKMGNAHAIKETDYGEKWPLSGKTNTLRMDCYCDDIQRDDADLVKVVKELGEAANGEHASLKIIDIPDGVNFHIHEYDGMESIHENHRSWV